MDGLFLITGAVAVFICGLVERIRPKFAFTIADATWMILLFFGVANL